MLPVPLDRSAPDPILDPLERALVPMLARTPDPGVLRVARTCISIVLGSLATGVASIAVVMFTEGLVEDVGIWAAVFSIALAFTVVVVLGVDDFYAKYAAQHRIMRAPRIDTEVIESDRGIQVLTVLSHAERRATLDTAEFTADDAGRDALAQTIPLIEQRGDVAREALRVRLSDERERREAFERERRELRRHAETHLH